MARSGTGEPWHALDDPFETEDEDLCPLCMEELDISDLNFRPCPCGYRICRFCWHHIKEDLNKRCPGCRKEYDDSVVEFKPMKADELKRLQQAKKQREKERKDLELMNRKHLANVRVKQRNQVHIQGLTTKMANEDTLAQLKSNELFTQYGRIQKMFMSRRAGATNLFTPDARYQHVNLYINYTKAADALACIAGLDGKVLPDGHRVKATLGSTKYCPSFLRGVKCNNDNCTGAHEMAEQVDSGTSAREEMSTARHAQKDSEQRGAARPTAAPAAAHAAALPPTASWAHRAPQASTSGSQPSSPAPPASSLPGAPALAKQLSGRQHAVKTHPLPPKPRHDSFSSNASTPNHPLPPNPIVSAATATAGKSAPVSEGTQRAPPDPARAAAAEAAPPEASDAAPALDLPVLPPTVPAVAPPPGLGPSSGPRAPALPPGLPVPPPEAPGDSPKMARTPSLPPGLFPDADADFNAISSPGSFAFNLAAVAQDVKGKGKQSGDEQDAMSPFSSTFTSLGLADPITSDLGSNLLARTASLSGSALLAPLGSSPYYGSFDPFADSDGKAHDAMGTPPAADDARNRGSRFGFAKRDSMGMFAINGAESPGSSIRSTLAGPPGLERSESNRPSSAALPEGRIVSSSSVASHGSRPVESGSSTPDASVLFPGVNLAASYSANAMPAALAARGLKSSSSGPRQGSFPSPVTETPSYTGRFPGGFGGSPQSAGYASPNLVEQAFTSPYQDPAILNMRMAAAAAAAASSGSPYGSSVGPPVLPPEVNGFGGHYASLSAFAGPPRSPFEHQQPQQHYGQHPTMGRQQSYFGPSTNAAAVAAAAAAGLQRGEPSPSYLPLRG